MMTSRERVLKTIEMTEADKIPIDLGGPFSGIVEVPSYGGIYKKLANHLCLEVTEPILNPAFKYVINIDEKILKRFQVDFRYIYAGGPEPKFISDDVFFDEWGIGYKSAGLYYEPRINPLKDAKIIEDIERYSWPNPHDSSYTKDKAKEAKNLYNNTDYSIIGIGGYAGYIFGLYTMLTGYTKWLLDMKLNVDFYKTLSNRIFELEVAILDDFLNEAGDYLDIIALADDFGTQKGPAMSIEDFRKFCKPYLANFIKEIKKRTKAKIFLHSCGSVFQFINDFIDIGVDILNPIQPQAYQMDPKLLKEQFNKRICFHGGIDAQRILPFENTNKVKEAVKSTISILAKGGGYIIGTSHVIGPEVPPENIVAMFETANKYGQY